MMVQMTPSALYHLEVSGHDGERYQEILTPEALAFVRELHRTFFDRRNDLLQARHLRNPVRDGLGFLAETAAIRDDDSWRVPAPAPGLVDRRVEITGPPDRKMTVNALNSGADVWMADFEDATSPTWANVVEGQINLHDAIRGTLGFTDERGKAYALGDDLATIVVRPRGWHLLERHIRVDGCPVPAALVDFGLFFFHNAVLLAERGEGPYFYLPKLESHLEARLWNDVFAFAEGRLGLERGTVRATVLIETITAAFEMEEILYELHEHAAGLNAGRWDYIFSVIKQLGTDPAFVLPDRADVTMTVPFMHAYTELLVRTCHKRGAYAIGGMAAVVPARDPEAGAAALAKVRADKDREAGAGFDGSWVAHPGLVPICQAAYDAVLGEKPNQLDRLREDVAVTAADLLTVDQTPGSVTIEGIRANLGVTLEYLDAWLDGRGAVAIAGLMEDAATVEISRCQLWQWMHHATPLDPGGLVTPIVVRQALEDELAALTASRALVPARVWALRDIVETIVFADTLPPFFTEYAYRRYIVSTDG
jgi:malate synthase